MSLKISRESEKVSLYHTENLHRGDVGLKDGLVGEYRGDVGLNDGDCGLYLGDVGENDGEVGE